MIIIYITSFYESRIYMSARILLFLLDLDLIKINIFNITTFIGHNINYSSYDSYSTSYLNLNKIFFVYSFSNIYNIIY